MSTGWMAATAADEVASARPHASALTETALRGNFTKPSHRSHGNSPRGIRVTAPTPPSLSAQALQLLHAALVPRPKPGRPAARRPSFALPWRECGRHRRHARPADTAGTGREPARPSPRA